MLRKHKVYLIGLSFAFFILLLSTATWGTSTPVAILSESMLSRPESVNSLAQLPPPPGMVSYWEFNEGGGTLASDSIGFNDGTLRDGGMWVLGIAGSGLDLAPHAYVECGGDPSLSIQTLLTIEAWVMLPDTQGIRTIVQNGNDIMNKMYHFAIEDGFLYFDRYDGSSSPANVYRSHIQVTPGMWHYVAVLMDEGMHELSFYIDDVMDPIGGFNDPYTGLPYSRFTIGYGQDPMTGHSPTFFNGFIDEVAVYDALLSAEVILQHFHNGQLGLGYLDGGIQEPLEAVDDSFTTDEDVMLDVAAPGVLINDIGNGLTADLEAGTSSGSLSFYSDGSFQYIPFPDSNGIDTFTYSMTDGFTVSNIATVTITVNAVNDAPVGVDDSYAIDEDTPLDLDAPGILENDFDIDGDSLVAVLVDAPLHGSVVLNADGSLSYIPDADWYGTDYFTYQAFDGTDYSGIVTVTIEVSAVGDAPRAQDDFYTTDENVPLIIDALSGVLVNDTDPDDDLLASQIVTAPSHGSLDFNVDGSFIYTPDLDWYGVDTFVYQAMDGILLDTATVTITVIQANKPPVAIDDFYTTNEDLVLNIDMIDGVLANDTDGNGDALTALLVSAPSHGLLALNPDGSFTYTPDPDWYGVDSFDYEVSDGELIATGTVTITVNSINDYPVALDDTYVMDEDGVLVVNSATGVLVNDYDVDGDALEAYWTELPTNGDLNFNLDGSFTYTPNPDFWGTDSFTYLVYDGIDASEFATVTITINAVQDVPVAMDDFYSTNEDTALSTYGAGMAGVLVNDYDGDGDPLEAALVDYPVYGTISFDPDGNFLYVPEANFYGIDSFTYYVSDGVLTSNTAVVTITVNSVNDYPVAVDDMYAVDEDGVLVVDSATGVLANDYDVDGDALEAYWVELPTNGDLHFNLDGSFTYTPNPNFWGTDFFTYLVYDGIDASDIVKVTITVNPVNDAPVAVDDFYSTDEDTELSTYGAGIAGILVNDYDADGDSLEVHILDYPAGTLIPDIYGDFVYIPNPDFWGTDFFTYYLSDGVLTSNIATVTITVNSVNDAPVAFEDEYQIDEDGVLSIPAPGLLSNDYDVDGDFFFVADWSDPEAGSLVVFADGSLEFIPDSDWNGVTTFEYWIFDGLLYSNAATVTIHVLPVNDAPVAVDDSYSTNEDTPLIILSPGVLIGDTDVENDPLTTILETGPVHGTLTLYSDGSFDYFPDPNFFGTDTFTYIVFDGALESNVATVTIDVIPVNDAPIANDDAFTTSEDTLLRVLLLGVIENDFDADGDPLFIATVLDPSHGQLTMYSNGSFTYMPNPDWFGIDTFEYAIGDGMIESNLATVTIEVLSVNDAPIADDDDYSTNEDIPLIILSPGVLIGDTDTENDALTALLQTGLIHGALILNSDGSFDYTPDPNFYGTDSFTYVAFDGELESNIATVTITVNPVNDAPVAVDDYAITDEDTPVDIIVLANDWDLDGDTVSTTSVTQPLHGMATINADGTVTYIPDLNYYGADSFTYTIDDGKGDTDTGTVTITVNPVNDAPVAFEDEYQMDEDGVLSIPAPGLLSNDYDVDGDFIFVEAWSDPGSGSLEVYEDGSFQFIPDPDWNGVTTFEYWVFDGLVHSNAVAVTIDVLPVNDAPVAVDDGYTLIEDLTLQVPAVDGVLANDTDVDGDLLTATLVSGPLHGEFFLGADGSFDYLPDWNFDGVDSFVYRVSDGVLTDTATVTITMIPVNDAPEAENDYAETDEDTSVYIDVLANDHDAEGDYFEIGFINLWPEAHGFAQVVDVAGWIVIQFTPEADYNGDARFTYDLNVAGIPMATAYVYVTILPVNDAPVAVDDMYDMDEDGVLIVDTATGVLANDYDVEGNALEAYFLDLPSNGILSLNLDGSFTYTPNSDFWGTDFFTYLVHDGIDASEFATVTITVHPVNDAPVALEDEYQMDEDGVLSIPAPGLLSNDYDIEGDFIFVDDWSDPDSGSLMVNEDGSFDYIPDPNWNGVVTFEYWIFDGLVHSNVVTVTIYVLPVDDPPVAVDDYVTTDEDTPITIDVLANDYDVDGDSFDLIDYYWSSAEPRGELTLVAVGGIPMIQYTPDSNWHGSAWFTYDIGTTSGHLSTAHVYITVNSVEDAPVAVDDVYSIDEDGVLQVDAASGVLANDYDDDGDSLTLQLISNPSHSSLLLNPDGSFTYTPDPNWNGMDLFIYEISDGDQTDTATVTITVNPVDDPPVAVDDYATTDEDTPITIDVLANDYDVDGDSFDLIDYYWSSAEPRGELTLVAVGGIPMIQYTPDSNWHGSAWFTYDIGTTSGHLSTAYVYITVNPVNDAPVGVDDEYTIDEDGSLNLPAPGVLTNDYDVDGDTITAILVSAPQGSGSFSPNGALNYYPPANWHGVTTLTYRVFDGAEYSDIVTVTITVNSVNDAPVGVDDDYTIDEDTSLDLAAPGLLANDYDVDGDTITLVVVTVPSHGTGSIGADGSFSYTPHPDWYGTDSMTYQVFDGTDYSGIVTVTIKVNSVNDAPVAVDDYVVIDEDTSVIIDFMGNDYDIDDSFVWTQVSWVPSDVNGALELVQNYEAEPGVFRTALRYTPNPDWYGSSSSITYIIKDSFGAQASARIYITVNPVNDPPVALDDYVVIDEDTSVIIDFLGNDYDVDDTFSWQYATWSAIEIHGQLEVVYSYEVEPGVFRDVLRYTPDPDWYGSSSSISYGIADSFGAQSSAKVYITVNPVNDPPVAVDDYVVIDEDTSVIIDFMGNDYDVDDSFGWDYVAWAPAEINGELEVVYGYEVEPGVFRDVLMYTPNPDWYGSISTINYRISDTFGAQSSIAGIFITVNPMNDAPVGVDDSYTIDEDTSLNLPAPGVLANDYDVDGDATTLDLQTHPQYGNWAIGSNGLFNYYPPADWYGTDSFTYRVFDGTTYSEIVTVTVTVNPVNDAPVAVDDYITINEDTSVIIDFMANDYDIDSSFDWHTITRYPSELHGTSEILHKYEVSPGVFRTVISYTPDPNWYGSTSAIYYDIWDAEEAVSATAYIHITVNSVNDAPVGVDDSYTIDEDTPLVLPAPGVLSNDYDVDGDTLTLVVVTMLGHGSGVIGSGGSFSYTPDPNWYGTDSFTYRVFDGTAYSGIVTVTVTVEPVNDAPVAEDDAYTTGEDVVLVVDAAIGVLANDDDVDGDVLSVRIVSGASHGYLVFNADGSFTYAPDVNWFGEDFFTYEVTDGTFTDTATVAITVLPVNDAPMAVNDTYSTLEDVTLIIGPSGVLANDFDIDGDTLTTVLLDMPLHGIVLLEPDGAFTYIPDPDYYGFDIFTYQVFDGTETSDKAFVIIEVIYVNTPPTAYNDVYTTEAGVSLIVEAPGVLANDVDVDEEDILEAMLVDTPMHGMLVLLPDGWFNYTPDAAWCGVDTFTYYAFDGLENSNIATVTIKVVDVTPPVTTIQFVGDAGEYDWYYSDVEVILTATDDFSGVALTLYSVNGSEWMTYIDPFVLTDSGEYIIRYYSLDNAGNIEDTHTAVAKISKYTRGYVSGAGWISEADGSKGFFSILAKYRGSGSLYGHIHYMFKGDEHQYAIKVKDSQIIGLIIDGNHAIIEAKGIIYRIGWKCHYYHYAEVFHLRIEVWDNGKGKSDVFQIRIFDESGDLFHEAGFDPPGTLLRGSIRIGPRNWHCWSRDWW